MVSVVKVKPEYEELFPIKAGRYFLVITYLMDTFRVIDKNNDSRDYYDIGAEYVNVYEWDDTAWVEYCLT